MELILARSKAGHDKGKIFAVYEKDDEYCYLTDGNLRPIEKLKKKKLKHIQPIYNLPTAILDEIKELDEMTNQDIRRIIRLYESH